MGKVYCRKRQLYIYIHLSVEYVFRYELLIVLMKKIMEIKIIISVISFIKINIYLGIYLLKVIQVGDAKL